MTIGLFGVRVMAVPVVLSMNPPLMVNVAAAVPKAEALLMFSVPAFSVTPPLSVFAPDNVRAPAPFLMRVVAVVPLAITPPSVNVPAFVVMVRLVPTAVPRVVAPVPKLMSRVVPRPPMKVKSPLMVSG
jgi:hypothetical protein